MKTFFWQNIPSHIQGHALREFSFLWSDEVNGIWCSEISEDRRTLGWQKPDPGRMLETTLPINYRSEVHRLISANRDAIHVFSGLHAYAPVITAFNYAVHIGVKNLALMVEPGIGMGWRGLIRPIRAMLLARYYRPHIRAILAMGEHGVRFYHRAGFAPEILFPYMYQCESVGTIAAPSVRNPVRLVYVGKFIPRKGVDVMIRGLGRCLYRNWRLTIIGDGPETSQLLRLAHNCGIAERTEWLGVKPSNEIPSLLAQHDICLIPSRFEGWGVVTNEALTAGLAVVCSDRTSSLDLVQASKAGVIFRCAKPRELARVMDQLLSSPELITELKARAVAYRMRISPQRVGAYMRDVLTYVFLKKGDRPYPPWMNKLE